MPVQAEINAPDGAKSKSEEANTCQPANEWIWVTLRQVFTGKGKPITDTAYSVSADHFVEGTMIERLIQFIVWRLLPKPVVYWAAIRLMVHATTGKWGNTETPALLAVDALKRWRE